MQLLKDLKFFKKCLTLVKSSCIIPIVDTTLAHRQMQATDSDSVISRFESLWASFESTICRYGAFLLYKKKYVTLKYESCVYYRISYRIKSPSGEREDRQCIRWMRVCAIVKWMKRIG